MLFCIFAVKLCAGVGISRNIAQLESTVKGVCGLLRSIVLPIYIVIVLRFSTYVVVLQEKFYSNTVAARIE